MLMNLMKPIIPTPVMFQLSINGKFFDEKLTNLFPKMIKQLLEKDL